MVESVEPRRPAVDPEAVEIVGALAYEVVARPGPQDRLLLLVHGYGESPDLLTAHLDALDPGGQFLVVTPLGPFEKKGKRIWHRALSGTEEAPRQFLASLRALDALVESLCAEHGLDRSQAVFGGFSSGGGLAVGLTLASATFGHAVPAGCLAFCGFLPPVPNLPVTLDAVADVPVLLLSATDDVFMPIETGRESAEGLARLGFAVEFHELEQRHEITPAGAAIAGRWLAAVAAGERPIGGVPDLATNPLFDWVTALWAGADVVHPRPRTS